MKVRFMCGCLHTVEDPGFHHDDDGMLTCPIHGHRRYGWLSTGGRNHMLDHMTPLEYERWAIFGEPVKRTVEIHRPQHDERMNQDPEQIYFTIKASRNPNGVPKEVKDREITQEMKDDARRRLDLEDRTGWPVLDAQPKSMWDNE